MLNLLRRPSTTQAELDEGLAELGLNGTQHLIVHASLKSFGTLEGGARTVVDTLWRRTATLVAPAFTYNTLLNRPTGLIHARFHRDTRVSRDIGRIPQEMVERRDALRSFHPTLSFIALGQEAARITDAQSLENPYRPIGALYDLEGYALLIGVDFGSNTSIHYGEYLAGMPLLTRYVPIEGQVLPTAFPNCSADFTNLTPELHFKHRSVKIGQSTLRLYRVQDLVDTTIKFLNHDPEGLLCTYQGCRCQEIRDRVRREGLKPRPHIGL